MLSDYLFAKPGFECLRARAMSQELATQSPGDSIRSRSDCSIGSSMRLRSCSRDRRMKVNYPRNFGCAEHAATQQFGEFPSHDRRAK
jgi:hypothetical protein